MESKSSPLKTIAAALVAMLVMIYAPQLALRFMIEAQPWQALVALGIVILLGLSIRKDAAHE